jgi:hypothetical protein
MIINKNLMAMMIATAASTAFSLPSLAQYSIIGEQPAVGTLHQTELHLQRQLDKDYQLGLIDPFELSNRTRDLDAIRVHEEALRMSKHGLTAKGAEKIAAKLAAFQTDLDARAAANSAPATVASR